jgi:histidine triad (HIT) family protein
LSEDCIFCKILAGELPSFKVFESDVAIAFLDINPIHDGHALVVPKKHYPDFLHMPKEDFCEFSEALQKVAKAVKQATNADGINIGLNVGKAAGQLVFHAHAHVIPRFEGDGLKAWARTSEEKPELEQAAEKIRAALQE